MKLIKKQIDGLREIEVELRYAVMDAEVTKLIDCIEQTEKYVLGTDNGRHHKIRVSDIYYAESIDKKTFIYTENSIFRTTLRLYQLFDSVKNINFIQISKFCFVNIDVLESVRVLSNSRLEATLINGEKIHVSRTYLNDLKKAFSSRED